MVGSATAGSGPRIPRSRAHLVEHRRTEDLFLAPADERTATYVEGRFG